MRSSALPLDRYRTDKIANGYLEQYDVMFQRFLGRKITLLELGVYRGESLLLWQDYFPQGTIVGLDIQIGEEVRRSDRIHLFEGSQADTEFLTRVAKEVAPDGFDIIIDDASHVGTLTKISFWHLFSNFLKPHGIFAIEDWGTGYWDDWHDGRRLDLQAHCHSANRPTPFWMKNKHWLRLWKRLRPKTPMPSHDYGMVGFIKQLVDEQAARDVTRGTSHGEPARFSRFARMTIAPSIVFVEKAA
jgi:hypothetical protein